MAKVYGRLVVDKLDEVYLSVSTEDSIRKELSEFFKFKVPGAEFIPAVRKRFWDGYIRLFNLQKNQIYMGLYPYLKEFCEEIIKRKLNISWQLPTGTRSEAIDEEVAFLLKGSGMTSMAYACLLYTSPSPRD